MLIKIFLGTEPGQWFVSEVLKASIRRRTKADVQFFETRAFPLLIKSKVNVGLSLYRFYIPESLHYEGKALYLDPQTLCLGDIRELFDLAFQNNGALARPVDSSGNARFSNVMLLDCKNLRDWKVKDWIQAIDKNPALLREFTGITSASPIAKDFGNLPAEWNAVYPNEYQNGKLLFLGNNPTVPWKDSNHPFYQTYQSEVQNALRENHIPKDALEFEILQGNVDLSFLK